LKGIWTRGAGCRELNYSPPNLYTCVAAWPPVPRRRPVQNGSEIDTASLKLYWRIRTCSSSRRSLFRLTRTRYRLGRDSRSQARSASPRGDGKTPSGKRLPELWTGGGAGRVAKPTYMTIQDIGPLTKVYSGFPNHVADLLDYPSRNAARPASRHWRPRRSSRPAGRASAGSSRRLTQWRL
jgi:hypothetical protein